MKKGNGRRGGMKTAAWLTALVVMIFVFPEGILGTGISAGGTSESEGPNQETCDHSFEISYEEGESTVWATALCTKCGKIIEVKAPIAASVKDPTCEEGGYTLLTASFSSPFTIWTKKTNETARLGHSLSAVAAVEPTCTTEGNSAYWVCGTCGKYFSDAAGTSETSAAAVKLPAKGHALSAVAAVEPTCTTGGNSAYWVCGTCGKYFSDAAGTSETSAAAVKLPAAGHKLTVTGAQLPTSTRKGHVRYWTCSSCGQRFGDADGYYPLSESDVRINARSHQGGTAICGAQAVCTVCNQPYGEPGPHPNDQIKTRIVTDPVTGKKVEEEYCELCGKVLSTKTLGKELDSGVFVMENIGQTTIGDQASEKIPMRETNEQKIIRQMMEVYTKKLEQIGINPSIINNKKTPWSSFDKQVEYVEAYADERGSYEGGLLH